MFSRGRKKVVGDCAQLKKHWKALWADVVADDKISGTFKLGALCALLIDCI